VSEANEVVIQKTTRLKFLRELILVTIFLFCALSVSAKVLTFERGGAYDSTGIVDPGSLTFEGGLVSYSDEFDGSGASLGLGSSLLRYGLFDKFELRARNAGVLFQDSLVGFDNLGLGFKYAILDEEHGLIPVINLTSDFRIPVGRSEFRNPGFNHSYQFSMSHGITEKFSWFSSFTPSFISRQDISGEFSTIDLPYVFNLSYAVNDKLTVFSDIYGQWGFSSFSDSPLSQDVGMTYAFTDDYAMDLSFNWGLNESAPDFGIDCGLAVRLLD